MFKDADANLVQVLEEAVEDGHQVGCRQLVAQNHRQLMDGEGQRSTHLPLSKTQCYKLQAYPNVTSSKIIHIEKWLTVAHSK